MTNWLAGMEITADRLNTSTPEIVTSGVVTIDPAWTLLQQIGTKVDGMTSILVRVSRASTSLTSDATGNLVDTLMFTVDSDWLPNAGAFGSELIVATMGDGFADGTALLNSATGACNASTWTPSQSIRTDRFLRMLVTYPT